MIPEIRNNFNTQYSKEKYENILADIEKEFPGQLDFRVAESPFFVDKDLVYTFNPPVKNEDTWPFNQPFYFLINLAIGGNFGGPAVDDTVFPQDYSIDYIKVYQ